MFLTLDVCDSSSVINMFILAGMQRCVLGKKRLQGSEGVFPSDFRNFFCIKRE